MHRTQLCPRIDNATDVSAFAGNSLTTRHIAGAVDSRSFVEFSSTDRFLAHILPNVERIDVWDIASSTLVCRLKQNGACGVVFTSDDLRIVIFGETGGTIWDLQSGSAICQFDWSSYYLTSPLAAIFSPMGDEFTIASGASMIRFDAYSGAILQTRSFHRSTEESTILSVDSTGGMVSQVTHIESDGNVVVEVDYRNLLSFSSHPVLKLPHTAVVIAAQGHLVTVRDDLTSMAEVWDLTKRRLLCKFSLLSGIGNMQVGPNLHLLAYAYTPLDRSEGCGLQVWDLQNGTCVKNYFGTLSWDIIWSQKSGIMSMFNIFPYEKHPVRNLVIFLNPISGDIVAHTYGHSQTSSSTYRLSLSGCLLGSVFTCDYLDNDNNLISAGTIALTDLSSVVSCPPSRLSS